ASDSDFEVPLALLLPPEPAGPAEPDAGFDSDGDELEESGVEGSSAQATAGVVATAPLIPRATARAPMRPMYLAYEILAGVGLAEPGSARNAGSFPFPPGEA